jgi:3-phosphoshikimate 1-carboxyvinyltransferase
MPLPDLIEIEPMAGPVTATVTVPGSKSITNRALILAALADGRTRLLGALWSEDTQVMVDGLRRLGFTVEVSEDPNEPCNRTLVVEGRGGEIPAAGTRESPLELFVGNAGTAARFLAALTCLGRGYYRLHGVSRMHERPQGALFGALRELGYRIEATRDRLPAVIHGDGPRRATCVVSIAESSQFASALLLGSQVGGWEIEVTGENAEESPYVALTIRLIAAFAARAGAFTVEPDCSSGSYFWGAGSVTVARWPQSGWQMDEAFPSYWAALCPEAVLPGPGPHRRGEEPRRPPAKALRREGNVPVLSRRDDLGDSIMTAIALAPLLAEPVRFTELGRLRVQECERVAALRTELSRCGARVEEAGDTLTVWPSKLHGAVIETYADHRMAMCFAILGLKVPGIRLQNPACVRKTFPNFFQKLVAPPPTGLGAGIRDASTGEVLGSESLLAD